MNRNLDIAITVALSAVVFFALSAVAMIVVGPDNTASQVSAHHGDTDDPPWVNPDGTMNKDLMPDRMPVPDGNGGIIGYVEIDKDPNDDPEPGAPGFEEWNTTQTVYVNETGGEIAGKIHWDGPRGVRDFRTVAEMEEEAGSTPPTE